MRVDRLHSIFESLPPNLEFMDLIREVSDRLVTQAGAVSCRIWLRRSGDSCDACSAASECQDGSECLHLVATSGRLPEQPTELNRCPIGVGTTGLVAHTGATLISDNPVHDARFSDDPWLGELGVQGCAILPLTWQGRNMGVLCVYCRERLDDDQYQQLLAFLRRACFLLAQAQAADALRDRISGLDQEVESLRREILSAQQVEQLIGTSPAARRLREDIQSAAAHSAPLLIVGPPGVGKELVARSVHAQSARDGQPFLRINCHEVAESTAECMLFGYESGAFACGGRMRSGHIELASTGTVFLRHIDRLSLPLQIRLRSFLESGRFTHVGGAVQHSSGARIIASTTRDPSRLPGTSTFDPDLQELLSRHILKIPSLQERCDDIPLLVRHYVERFSRDYFKKLEGVESEALQKLSQYAWPGNDRELSQVLERAVLLSTGPGVRLELGFVAAAGESTKAGPSALLTLQDIERAHIVEILRKTRGIIQGPGGAAALLGLRPSTLRSRMAKLGIPRHP